MSDGIHYEVNSYFEVIFDVQVDPGVRGRTLLQRLALTRHCCHGAGADGDAGHVEQGQLPQAATPLQQRRKLLLS